MDDRSRLVPALLLTVGALLAFAANSVLCRLALGDGTIDAWSYTAVRLGSGALTLLFVTLPRRRTASRTNTGWAGAAFLLIYALPFSLAYVRMETGTGALLLFGAVQLTMIGLGIRAGERPGILEWAGVLGALFGVAYLVSPGLTAPDPISAGLMVLAGIGWGAYSLVGKAVRDPVAATEANFRRAAMVVVPATAVALPWLSISPKGVLLAIASGALASGLGYVVWFAALRYLTATRAALVQLSVPVIAAAGGVLFVAEPITPRLAVASLAILGSIALGICGRSR